MNKDILEYQKLDEELFRLKKEISNNKDKREVEAMKSFVIDSQKKSTSLDKQARLLIDELNKLKEVEKKGIAYAEKFNNQNIENLSLQEFKDLKQKMGQTLKQINEVNNRLQANAEKMKNTYAEYENNKKLMSAAKQKYSQSKEKFEEYFKLEEPKLNELKDKLLELQKRIDVNELNKYQAIKKDNIFPVYVPLVNDCKCGGCRIILPSNNLEKIKKYGKLECESCKRIIYIKD